MQIGWELGRRLEKLREFLADEIKRTKDEAKAKRNRAGAKIESSASGVVIVQTDMELNSGELVGAFRYSNDPEPIGFVVRKFERFGKKYYVINTKSIDYTGSRDILEICKVDFLYSLEKRLEAISDEMQDFKVIEGFEIIDSRSFVEGVSEYKLENKLPLDEFQKMALESSFQLERGEMLLVVGPPGTGKTQFITEAGRILGKTRKTLVVSQIHQAVDNVFERLADFEEGYNENIDYAIRVGHISKVSKHAKKFSPENRHLDDISEDLPFDGMIDR